MPNIREQEILHINEAGNPTAVSYDPGAFGHDTIKTILKAQITNPNPLEIHCYVRGLFQTIEAFDFTYIKSKTEEEQEEFIDIHTNLIKGLDTYDIIFSKPLKIK